jgi:hypothetical protein
MVPKYLNKYTARGRAVFGGEVLAGMVSYISGFIHKKTAGRIT